MMMVSSIEATGTDPSTDPNTTTGIAYSHNRFCPVVKGASECLSPSEIFNDRLINNSFTGEKFRHGS